MDYDGINRFKHPDVVHTKPNLDDVMKYVGPQYSAKWKVLGTLLSLPSPKLNIIEYDNHFSNCDLCLHEMFAEWLNFPTATWKNLFTALDSPAIHSNFDEACLDTLRVSSVDDGELEQFKHPDKVNSRPLLEDLKQHFSPQYATDWKTIGILLELPAWKVAIIRANLRGRCVNQCNAMLQMWLETDPTASWTKLFNIIKSPVISSTSSEMMNQLKDKDMSGPSRFPDVDDGGLEQFKVSDKINTTPLLKDLYEYITPCYAADWKVIGTLLGLPIGKLKAIEIDYSYRVKDQCNEMFERWL